MFARLTSAAALALWLALPLGFGPPALAGRPAAFPLGVGDQIVEVEIAESMNERSRGLMFRRSLEQDRGMLFIFPQPQRLSFWMRNTAIPLDIGFFDSGGVLSEIHQLQPFDERPVVSESARLRFALEVNRGWFAAHEVNAGARLDLEALAGILAQRKAVD